MQKGMQLGSGFLQRGQRLVSDGIESANVSGNLPNFSVVLLVGRRWTETACCPRSCEKTVPSRIGRREVGLSETVIVNSRGACQFGGNRGWARNWTILRRPCPAALTELCHSRR